MRRPTPLSDHCFWPWLHSLLLFSHFCHFRKDSATYVRNKKKACDSVGIKSFEVCLAEDSSEEEVLKSVSGFNDDPSVHGILVQLPLPSVLQKALEVWDLQVIPLNCPDAEPAQIDPELESAFICHLHDHWFCIRKVNGEWYNFDSLLAAPQHLSKFYLSAFLDSLKGSGWSIFIVKGNFPQECPMSSSSEASNSFGQWLSPEDAERIIKNTSSVQGSSSASTNRSNANVDQQRPNQALSREEVQAFSEMEDDDLKAAIAASLLDASAAGANLGAIGTSKETEEKK